MKKIIGMVMFLAFLFPAVSSASEEFKVTSEDIDAYEEAMEELNYDSELTDQVLNDIDSGIIPDVLNPEAKVISEDTFIDDDTIITREFYEDGTYEEVSIKDHNGLDYLEEPEFQILNQGYTRNVTVKRTNLNVVMEFAARITHVNRGDSFINSVSRQFQASATGNLSQLQALRIIRKYANGQTPALAGFSLQWNGTTTGSYNYKLGLEVIRSTYNSITLF